MEHRRTFRAALAAALALLAGAAIAQAKGFGEWGAPVNAESVPGASADINTAFNDGCPIESPDGRHLYIASNRPGGLGGQDIWIATRAMPGDPWGAPVNLGEPVNSAGNDFCPTPLSGKRLLFVTDRPTEGGCGGADIYLTRHGRDGWSAPRNLGCAVNSASGEAGPSLVEINGTTQLYFSSTRAGGFSPEAPGAVDGDADIYVSVLGPGGFAPAELVAGLNTASDDSRPNVRRDGRELVFDSTRPGTLGGPDIFSATRSGLAAPWSAAVHLAGVNTAAVETRASLSSDGKRLTFGSSRPGGEGMADIYVATREPLARKMRGR